MDFNPGNRDSNLAHTKTKTEKNVIHQSEQSWEPVPLYFQLYLVMSLETTTPYALFKKKTSATPFYLFKLIRFYIFILLFRRIFLLCPGLFFFASILILGLVNPHQIRIDIECWSCQTIDTNLPHVSVIRLYRVTQ